jgi:hypothetical protein
MLSALVVPVPRVGPIVEPWLERTVPSKPSIGIPAHVTLLFPFVPAEEIEYGLLDDLEHFFAGFGAFGFTLPRTARFPTTLYLDPEPAGPFVELTKAICAQWPGYEPYGGAFDEIVPHLTVAQGEPELLDLAEADVAPKLPLTARAAEVLLLEEVRSFWQEWRTRGSFPLGAAR